MEVVKFAEQVLLFLIQNEDNACNDGALMYKIGSINNNWNWNAIIIFISEGPARYLELIDVLISLPFKDEWLRKYAKYFIKQWI